MAVIDVNHLSQGGGRRSLEGVSYRDVYQVLTDNASDDVVTILQQTAFPSIGDEHYAGGSFVTSIDPSQDKNDRTTWYVTINYEPPGRMRQDNPILDKQTPPTQRPTQRRWGTIPIEKIAVEDTDGNAILNSAGIAYDPPLTYRVHHPVATFQRWESTFTNAGALAYVGHINSETWGAYEAGQVMCTDISADEVYEDGKKYWLVTYQFEANLDGWQPRLLSNGTLQKTADGMGHERITDDDGNDVTEPVALDEDGRAVPPHLLPANAYVKTENIYETANFNDLSLPLDP